MKISQVLALIVLTLAALFAIDGCTSAEEEDLAARISFGLKMDRYNYCEAFQVMKDHGTLRQVPHGAGSQGMRQAAPRRCGELLRLGAAARRSAEDARRGKPGQPGLQTSDQDGAGDPTGQARDGATPRLPDRA